MQEACHRRESWGFMLRLHVTQLWTLNSGSILRTNSDPTLRLVPEFPIGTTLYHSISDPQIPPLLLDMVSLLYFLFKHCFTLPYLLFPALPSAMPVCSDLLISKFPESLSEPIRLSLYVHNTFRSWKVLCSLFVQTSNYISRTNSCMLLQFKYRLIFDIVLSEHYSLKSSSCSTTWNLFLVVLVWLLSLWRSHLQPPIWPCLAKLRTRWRKVAQHISWSQVPPNLTHSDIQTSRLHSGLTCFDH